MIDWRNKGLKIQRFGRYNLGLFRQFEEYLEGEELVIEVSGNSAGSILKEQDLTTCQMLGRTSRDDLVEDSIELDLEVLGDDAEVMDGEKEIQVKGGIEGNMRIASRSWQDSEFVVVELDELR